MGVRTTVYAVVGDLAIAVGKPVDKLQQGDIYDAQDAKKKSLVPKGMEIGDYLAVFGEKDAVYFEKVSARQYRLSNKLFDGPIHWRINLHPKTKYNKLDKAGRAGKPVNEISQTEIEDLCDEISYFDVYEGDLLELSFEGNPTGKGYVFEHENNTYYRVEDDSDAVGVQGAQDEAEPAIFVYYAGTNVRSLRGYKVGETVTLKDLGKVSIPTGYEKGKFVLFDDGHTSVWLLKTAKSLKVVEDPFQTYPGDLQTVWVTQLTPVKYDKLKEKDDYSVEHFDKLELTPPFDSYGQYVQVEMKGSRNKWQYFKSVDDGFSRDGDDTFVMFVPFEEAVKAATPAKAASSTRKTPAGKPPTKKTSVGRPPAKPAAAKEVIRRGIIIVDLDDDLFNEYDRFDTLDRAAIIKALSTESDKVRPLRAGDIFLFMSDKGEHLAFEVKRATLERLDELELYE